jgi:hypothetical protein
MLPYQSQDKFATSALSFNNASSRCLPSHVKTEVLNLHHYRQPPSPYRPTLTLHCYKKVISTLSTLSITQPRFYFTSSLIRAPYHRSYTHRRHSLSPPSHTHHPLAHQHLWWQTSQFFFLLYEQIIDMWIYIKKYFKISQHQVIN